MKLLKIISVVFIIYFVRRFIQLYRAMKKIQEAQANMPRQPQSTPKGSTINADFKVVD
jgi:hypothetical protein